jgi:hypothetical protein
MVTRIGTDPAVVTDRAAISLVTGSGLILATALRRTVTSPVTGMAQALDRAPTDRYLAMILTATAREAMARLATGQDRMATAMAAATVRHRRLVSTVLPLTEVTAAGRPATRREPTGTGRRRLATTTGLRRSTEATAISSGPDTMRAVIRASIRHDLAMAGAGRAGPALVQLQARVQDLIAGYHRAGKAGDGLATRPLADPITETPIRGLARADTRRADATRRTTGSRRTVRRPAGGIRAGRRTAMPATARPGMWVTGVRASSRPPSPQLSRYRLLSPQVRRRR